LGDKKMKKASKMDISYARGILFDALGEKTEGILDEIRTVCETENDWNVRQKTILGLICGPFADAGRGEREAKKVSIEVCKALSNKDEKAKEVNG
jgi:hypothetical protein